MNILARWKVIKQLITKLTLNYTNSKQSILTGLRFLYYPLNNNKFPKVLSTLSSILANFTYLMAFPFYALQTVSCTYLLLFLVPLLGTVRFSESAQPNRVQVRTLLHVTVELAMKQVTNSGSFQKNDDFFLFFITSRRYVENNQQQANSWLFKFSFPLKEKLLLQSIYVLAT